jgi:hypothetical protein
MPKARNPWTVHRKTLPSTMKKAMTPPRFGKGLKGIFKKTSGPGVVMGRRPPHHRRGKSQMEFKIMRNVRMHGGENSRAFSGTNHDDFGHAAWEARKGLPIMYDVKKGMHACALVAALLAACVPREEGERFSDALASRPKAAAFAWAGDFSEGLAPVLADPGGKFGFVDTAGRLAIAAKFTAAGGFSLHRAPVLRDGRWGYLDVTGRLAIPAVYDWAGPFREGFAPVASADGYRFIDSVGRPLDSGAFAEARWFSEGLAAVRVGDEDTGAWGFIDSKGALAIPPLFAGVPGGFSQGLAAVEVEGEARRMGFIDTSGGFAFDTLFDAAGDFSEGLAPVGRGNRQGGRFQGVWGFLDTAGRMAVEPVFAWAGPFRGGRAMVRTLAGNYALIDRGGLAVQTFPDSIVPVPPLSEDRLVFKSRARYGYLDATGSEAVPARFREAGRFAGGWARARMGSASKGFWVYVDRKGAYLGGNDAMPVTSVLPQAR